MKLQSIRNFQTVVNYSILGRTIAKWSRKNISIPLDTIECGWLDGGCLAFATALQQLFSAYVPGVQTRLVSVGREELSGDHIALECRHPQYGVIYLDADGCVTEAEINRKMIILESVDNSMIKMFDTTKELSVSDYSDIGLPALIYDRMNEPDFINTIRRNFYDRNLSCDLRQGA